MNIATIQKRKFLNNIYKLFYSTGKTPSEFEVRNAFNQYFSTFKIGSPVPVDYNSIQYSSITNPTTLNELMINTLLNLEVLYDCIMENNQEAFSVVNALNDKMEHLKARRKELETRIDQLTFSIGNTDGFFYSFLENFATVDKIDLSMTNTFVDLTSNNVTLPKLTSEFSNTTKIGEFISPTVTNTVTFNGRVITEKQNAAGFDAVFDGLNDTYWKYEYQADSIGIASITLDIPSGSMMSISNISGSLMSKTPCSIFIKAIPADTSLTPIILTKTSAEDYNRFSFALQSQPYVNVQLTIYKSEPDSIIRNGSSPYLYSFGIRDLVIGADYYDASASVVSKPISIPSSDNSLLSITSVALDVKQQVVPGTAISHYVAVDNPNAKGIDDFTWIPIEPSSFESQGEIKSVDLNSSPFKTAYIDNDYLYASFKLIPINEVSNNQNELNPITLPYTGKTAYRVTNVGSTTSYQQPYLLSSLNCYRHYFMYTDSSRTGVDMYKSLSQWSGYINDSSNTTINRDVFNGLDSVVNITINSPCSGFLDTKILSPEIKSGSHIISKSRADFNLSIYLNGVLIADIPSGQSDAKVDWNFIKGSNNLSILYDKNFTGTVSFDLMQGSKLSDYGIIHLDYFKYLDPIEFNMRVEPTLNVFTIDSIYGSNEILASKQISNKTIFRYYSNQTELVTAIRYRSDLIRFNNPNQTPILDGVRVKFKHSDM